MKKCDADRQLPFPHCNDAWCGETPTPQWVPTVMIRDVGFRNPGWPYMKGLTLGLTILYECLHNMLSSFWGKEPKEGADGSVRNFLENHVRVHWLR